MTGGGGGGQGWCSVAELGDGFWGPGSPSLICYSKTGDRRAEGQDFSFHKEDQVGLSRVGPYIPEGLDVSLV